MSCLLVVTVCGCGPTEADWRAELVAAKAELAALDAAPLERRQWIEQQQVLMREHPEALRGMIESYQTEEPILQRAELLVRRAAEQRLQRARTNLCRISGVECDEGRTALPAAPVEAPAGAVREAQGSAPPAADTRYWDPFEERYTLKQAPPTISMDPPEGTGPYRDLPRTLEPEAEAPPAAPPVSEAPPAAPSPAADDDEIHL